MTSGRHECNKPKTSQTYSKQWSGVTYAPAAKGRKCSQCGKHVHKESGEYYCPHCDDYVKTIGSYGAKKSKPKRVGNCPPLVQIENPFKSNRLSEKFMTGVSTKFGGYVSISKSSTIPVAKVFKKYSNNADVKSIMEGVTRNTDGSIQMTKQSWNKFVDTVYKTRPSTQPVTMVQQGSFGKRKSPKNIGNVSCNSPACMPPPASKAETKFLKGVTKVNLQHCNGDACTAVFIPGYRISTTSAAPFVKVFGKNTNNADIQAIKAGSTRNADGSIMMTDAAFGKFVGIMNTKYPNKINYQYRPYGYNRQ
jgi:hypothetical protein